MSANYQNTRISNLLFDLVCILDHNHGHSNIDKSVKQYSAALRNHRYLTTMDGDVNRSFNGICEKIALSGRKKERYIMQLEMLTC